MKQHARWYRAILAAVGVAIAMIALPAVASAIPNNPASYTTSVTVNGVPLPDPDGYFFWFNTPDPVVGFKASTVETNSPIAIGGFEYRLGLNGDIATDTAYAPCGSSGGPVSAQTVDLSGWADGLTGPLPVGAHNLIEGTWTLRAQSVAPGFAPGLGVLNTDPVFGIDVTPPNTKVDTPTITSVVTSQNVVTGSVATFSWPALHGHLTPYDELSGVAAWSVRLNGSVITTFQRLETYSTHPTATVTVENLPVGASTFEVAAVDWAGNIGPYSSILPVYSKPSLPGISFTSPVGSALTPGDPITAVCSSSTIEPHVTITLDGVQISTATSLTCSVIPDLTHLSAGSHTLVASVVDKWGNYAATPPKIVTWTPPIPTITFTAPAGSSLIPSAPVSVDAASSYGNPSVTIFLDGVSIGTFSSAPYTVTPDLTHLAQGTHTLTASATNIYGTAWATPKVVAWNPPVPTISIVTPAGSVFTADEAIEANVVSAYGNPTVTIRIDGTPIGTFTASPYSVVPDLSHLAAGSHVLSISATNLYGTATLNKTLSWTPPVPVVKWTSPTVSFLTLLMPISVDVSSISTPTVTIAIDGAGYTFPGPPYSLMPDLNLLSEGTHVLTATVTNKYGTTSITKTVTWNPNSVSGFIPSSDTALNTKPTGVSSTNPSDPSQQDAWWRMGWGKSVTPDFVISPPSTDQNGVGFIAGILYSLDRTAGTAIDVTQPLNYFRTAIGSGTQLHSTVDVMSTLAHPPAGGWPPLMAGAQRPEEGYWDFHLAFFTTKGFASRSWYIPFGIDRTPPRAVTGLKASPSLDVADADKWTDSSRANITWQPAKYDSLSGVAYYQVLVDGSPTIPEAGGTGQGKVFEIPGVTPSSITVEDMPPGKHKVSIVCVDRATNEGPAASTYFMSDPDVPTIEFGTFSPVLPAKPAISVVASDAGGIASVSYTLDGTGIGTSTSAPYTLHPNLSRFSNGSHTLVATVKDMFGRTASVSMAITLDKTAPTLKNVKTKLSGGTLKLTFTLNSPATVNMAFGSLRKSKFYARKGRYSLSLTYARATNNAYTTRISKHSWSLTATDVVGNVSKKSHGAASIVNWHFKKTGPNSVTVVFR